MLTQPSTVKTRLALTITDYDGTLANAIKAVSDRFDRECSRTLARIAFALLMLAIGSPALNGASVLGPSTYEYEAEGTLDVVRYLAWGNTQREDSVSFKVYVRDCQWLIHIVPGKFLKYRETSSDSQYMYTLGVLATPGVPQGAWGGLVCPDSVPFCGPIPHAPVIWLALADSCYLDKAGNTLEPPYAQRATRVRLPVQVARNSDVARLPKEIVFFDDGFDRDSGLLKKRSPPYDKGFTNAVYSVGGFTNLGLFSLPISFTLRVFRQADDQRGAVPDFDYSGTVTNVRPTCSLQSFVPAIPEHRQGTIEDRRLAAGGAIIGQGFQYNATNWPTIAEAEKLPGFAKYLANQLRLSSIGIARVTDPTGTIRTSLSIEPAKRVKIAAEAIRLAPRRSLFIWFFLAALVSGLILVAFLRLSKS